MKLAFWGLFVFGFVLCSTVGIGSTLERVGGSWTAPAMIAGSLVGVALFGLAVLFATGVRPAVLPTDTAMLAALVALIVVKVGIGAVQATLFAATRS